MPYMRGAYKERDDATGLTGNWSAEVEVTDSGRTGADYRPSRVIAGEKERLHFFWTDWRSDFRNEYHITLKANQTFGTGVKWLTGNLTYYSVQTDNLNGGQYHWWDAEDGTRTFTLPFKAWFGEPYYVTFVSADTLPSSPTKYSLDGYFVYEGNQNNSSGCAYPAIGLTYVEDPPGSYSYSPYFLIAKFSGSWDWAVYKRSKDSPDPDGRQYKVGPDLWPRSMQNCNVYFFKQGPYLYLANFFGLDVGESVGWQFKRVDRDLPDEVGYDYNDWVADLA